MFVPNRKNHYFQQVDKYSKIYPKYDLKRTSVNKWNTKCKSNKENTLIKKSGRPNRLSDELLQKTIFLFRHHYSNFYDC